MASSGNGQAVYSEIKWPSSRLLRSCPSPCSSCSDRSTRPPGVTASSLSDGALTFRFRRRSAIARVKAAMVDTCSTGAAHSRLRIGLGSPVRSHTCVQFPSSIAFCTFARKVWITCACAASTLPFRSSFNTAMSPAAARCMPRCFPHCCVFRHVERRGLSRLRFQQGPHFARRSFRSFESSNHRGPESVCTPTLSGFRIPTRRMRLELARKGAVAASEAASAPPPRRPDPLETCLPAQ